MAKIEIAKERVFEDTYRHKGLRKKLVESLREKGISDENVLEAINKVPRHFFLDTALDEIAYEDRSFSIEADQTISHPYTVAFQSQLLEVKPNQKVLEIGTGSMYQGTILAAMGAKVITIERQKQLYDKTKFFPLVKEYPQTSIRFFLGDGFEGLPNYAPFDKIIITCGAPFIPPKLINQLKIGGTMVIPLAQDEHHKMIRVTKNEDGSLTEESFSDFSFVPMLRGINK